MILLASCWIFYFCIHSLLASTKVKQMVSGLFPSFRYRLAFNSLAILLLFPPLWLLYVHPWPMLWKLLGVLNVLAMLLKAAAILGFFVSLRYYDMGEFLGLKSSGEDSFRISPFHRHVRHPWYFLSLPLLWASDMNAGRLVTCVLATAYLFIGSRHEEAMLIDRFGERYLRYRERVPGIIPLPWKHLSAEEAETLVK